MKAIRGNKKTSATEFLALRDALTSLFLAARRGDQIAAKSLLNLAEWSTRLVEYVYRARPEVAQAVFHGRDEFPILRSWKKRANADREIMISKLGLGAKLPLKVDGAQNEFFLRLVEERIPYALFCSMDHTFELPPLTDRQSCRKFARALTDFLYPKGKQLNWREGVKDEDWEFAKSYAAQYRARRLNRRKVVADDTPVGEFRKEVAGKLSYGDFRSGFIDALASRLRHAVKV